ncbi:hypothetical protein [Streptomyces sp. NPDC005930]|uniref:hypothetical protein n=1 Tax=Streptomyces sp. NPDC005930 TaxID=3364736 RepID=UPI0036809FED
MTAPPALLVAGHGTRHEGGAEALRGPVRERHEEAAGGGLRMHHGGRVHRAALPGCEDEAGPPRRPHPHPDEDGEHHHRHHHGHGHAHAHAH